MVPMRERTTGRARHLSVTLGGALVILATGTAPISAQTSAEMAAESAAGYDATDTADTGGTADRGEKADRGDTAPQAAPTPPLPRPLPPGARIDPETAADLFAMPQIAAQLREASEFAGAGELDQAALLLDRLVLRHPNLAELRANRAALSMLQGNPPAALADLEAAAGAGMDINPLLDDPIFAALRDDAQYARQLAGLAPPSGSAPPATAPPPESPVWSGRAVVSAANTAWNPTIGRLEPHFGFPAETEAPVLPPRPKRAAFDLLREHAAAGQAAGNHGDLYDNRDRGHSALRAEAHPQLSHVIYDRAAQEAGTDYGLAGPFLFGRPTFGNSSTAITGGPTWRSLPRHAYTYPDGTGPMRLWQEARANHLYVYPAHKDFTDERGDLFPANTPYILVSRGSSGSDKPFLEAVAMILAAFRPDTKARLIEEGLVTPTVQMVFRRSLQNVRSRESYFSSDAQRAVFDAYEINLARMVSLANAIAPEDIPAETQLRIDEESLGNEGVDFFGDALSEQLFDTPQAIARIWRSKTGRREMIVSAEESRDPNGRPLSFAWRLLQGDPEKVEIEPLDGGKRARITIDWHDPFKISEDLPMVSSRVDIGVFAHNGVHDSAPAILSWYFPPNEARSYETGLDGVPRIVAIDYADPARKETYADPILSPVADWRDTYSYAPDGALVGWQRESPSGIEHYTAQGERILTFGPQGQPGQIENIHYAIVEGAGGVPRIDPRPVGRGFPSD